MVSDSLTYVYSSHEWQQARATTSFGRDYRNAASGHKDTSKRGNTAASANAAIARFLDTLLSRLLSFIAARLWLRRKPRRRRPSACASPSPGCTALQT